MAIKRTPTSLLAGPHSQGGKVAAQNAWTAVSYPIEFNSSPVLNANYIAALENTVLRHVKLASVSTSSFRFAVVEGSTYTDSSIFWLAKGK